MSKTIGSFLGTNKKMARIAGALYLFFIIHSTLPCSVSPALRLASPVRTWSALRHPAVIASGRRSPYVFSPRDHALDGLGEAAPKPL